MESNNTVNFSMEDLVQVSSVVSVSNAKLFEVLSGLVARVSLQDTLLATTRDELASAIARAAANEKKLSLFVPDMEVQVAKNSRMEAVEASVAGLRESFGHIAEKALQAHAIASDTESTVLCCREVIAALQKKQIPDELLASVATLETRLTTLDGEFLKMSNDAVADREKAAGTAREYGRQLRGVTVVFGLPPPEDLCALTENADSDQRLGMVRKLACFTSLEERLARERAALEGSVGDRLTLMSHRLQDKVDNTEFVSLREVTMDFSTETSHLMTSLRHQIDVLMSSKADAEDTVKNFSALQSDKVDRSELASKLGPQDMRAMYTAIEGVKDSVTELWGKVVKGHQAGKPGPQMLAPRGSTAGAAAGDGATLDELKKKVADCERCIRVLDDDKADKRSLFELHEFVQTMLTSERAVIATEPPSTVPPSTSLVRKVSGPTPPPPRTVTAPAVLITVSGHQHVRIATEPKFTVDTTLGIPGDANILTTSVSPLRARARTGSPGNSFHLSRSTAVRDAGGSATCATIVSARCTTSTA